LVAGDRAVVDLPACRSAEVLDPDAAAREHRMVPGDGRIGQRGPLAGKVALWRVLSETQEARRRNAASDVGEVVVDRAVGDLGGRGVVAEAGEDSPTQLGRSVAGDRRLGDVEVAEVVDATAPEDGVRAACGNV